MTEKNLQVSGNIGNAYFIFKGDTIDELKQNIADLAGSYDEIADNFQKIQQIQLVKEAFAEKQNSYAKKDAAPAAKPSSSRTFNGPKESTTAKAPDGSYTCEHGAMELLDYVKKTDGKRVHGYYCQLKTKDYKQKCKPITLDGHGE